MNTLLWPVSLDEVNYPANSMAGWGYYGTRLQNHRLGLLKATRMIRYTVANGFDPNMFPSKPDVRQVKTQDQIGLGKLLNIFCLFVLPCISLYTNAGRQVQV